MNIYKKEFETRWSDLDANRHVANAAYLNFMSHTRMAYLVENGFSQKEMAQLNVGPVLFYEHIYYFKEIFGNQQIFVTMELKGSSDDGKLFMFEHNIYSSDGIHRASCEVMGGFIDLAKRSLCPLDEELRQKLFINLTKTEDYIVLTLADSRKHGVKPRNRADIAEQ